MGVDRRAGREGGPGPNPVAGEAFALGRVPVRRQEAGLDGGGRLAGRRVDRGEAPRRDASRQVDASSHVHELAPDCGIVHARAVEAAAGRYLDPQIAEPEIAQLEGAPVEVRGELLCDRDAHRGGRRLRLVLEEDRVRERFFRCDEVLRSEPRGPADVVRIPGQKLPDPGSL